MNKKLRIIALLVCALVILSLSACSGNGDQSTPPATDDKQNTTTPPDSGDTTQSDKEPGGETGGKDQMVIGIPALTASFDFFNTTNGYETFSMAQVYDTLVVKDDKGGYVNALAERYEISEDALTFTFYLNKDAKWSNGTSVKASDVKFSMDQLLVSAYTSWIYEPLLAEVNVVDEYIVEIVLQKSSVSLLEYLANPYYCSILCEEAYNSFGENYGTSVDTIVGSGPYRVTEWSVGESITFEANEDYYLGAAPIKSVKLVVMSDSSTAMFALQTGELDAFFSDVPGVSYDSMSNNPDITVVDFTSTVLYCTFFNARDSLFSDVKMRKAVAMAMSKEDYIVVGVEGFGVAADYPGDRGANATSGDPELHGIWSDYYTYDPEAAKALVDECGNTGKSVVIKTYSTDPYPALATVLQNAMNQIGLNVTIEQVERSTFISSVLSEGDFEMQVCRWAAGTEDMDEIIYGSLHTDSIGSPGNWSFYSNSELDGLIEQAASELDAAKREALYEDIVKIYLEECVYLPIFYPTSSRAFGSAVTIDEGYAKYDKFYYYSWK